MTVELVEPATSIQWGQARQLIEEYIASLGIDLSFQNVDEELRSLSVVYAPHEGAFFIAQEEGHLLGCVGVRPFLSGVAELKRMYVRPNAQGRGIGRVLAERAVVAAKKLGYAKLILDTLPSMMTALSLYRSLGFVDVPPYRFNPVPGTTYLELQLGSGG
ncbi:MAG: GNAT family N-acetyltransferase [Burkholderiaceae bacterium]